MKERFIFEHVVLVFKLRLVYHMYICVCMYVCIYHNIRYQRTVVESDEVIDTIVVANASYYSARTTTAPYKGQQDFPMERGTAVA
jgi:hypothetical protein